jgi:hypothetical protein
LAVAVSVKEEEIKSEVYMIESKGSEIVEINKVNYEK